MIIHNVQQGGPEWTQLRLAKPTAFNFDKILTKTRKLSTSADRYIHKLIAEWMLGVPVDIESTPFMGRGKAMEPEAVAWFCWEHDCKATPVGFVTTDDGAVGASPDRLLGDDGILEIKCPGAVEHVSNMLNMTDDYMAQVQGQLYVCERQYAWLVSYNPTLIPVAVKIERDQNYIDALHCALYDVGGFLERFEAAKDAMQKLGFDPTVVHGYVCRCNTADGPCGSKDGVTVVDGIAKCKRCAESHAELEKEIFG